MDQKPYADLKTERKDGEALLTGTVPVPVIAGYEEEALAHIQEEFEFQGFRKGQVPLDVVKRHVNEIYVLEDAADLALQDAWPLILEESKLLAVGRPEVAITKLALGNPVEFRIRVALVPEFRLPDYRKMVADIRAAEKPPTIVTDQEVDDTIRQILELRKKESKEPTPELTDEFAKTLGGFENATDLRAKLRTSMGEERETEARHARREAIAAKLAATATFAIPKLLVDEELAEAAENRAEEVKRAGITMEDYFKKLKLTPAELEDKERAHVERQLKTKFIFQKIAETEHLEADAEAVEENLHILQKRHPEADKERLRIYVHNMLVNEKVLGLLEGQDEKGKA